MEEQLKCVLQLSLKEMALRKVVVLLWSSSDIWPSISKFETGMDLDTESMEECRKNIKIKDKVLKLKLPESLTKQMIGIVSSIGLQIRSWKVYHYKFFRPIEEDILPESVKLCWTPAGTINYEKTAEELVRCDVLDVLTRYKIACAFCLEDHILPLYEELPEDTKSHFDGGMDDGIYFQNLEFCWPYMLRWGVFNQGFYVVLEEGRIVNSFYQWAFEISVEHLNKTAAEYFFRKLTLEERKVSSVRIVNVLIGKVETDFLHLLCLMTPEQQMELVKAHPVHVLLSFLYWPWQDLFLENASLFWSFLPRTSFERFLLEMAYRITILDFYIPKVFQEFFVRYSIDLKESFVGDENNYIETPACHFLFIFFYYEDSESIEVIFRNVDAPDRVKILFHPHFVQVLYDYILEDKWHLVEVCLREATLSKGDIERLKKVFTGFYQKRVCGESQSQNLKRFFDFLDETDASANKKKESPGA